MKTNSTRKGSALLIVLGMLAFMVISAVSFAIFMRQSRLPSSYLRRSSAARNLLKAALANAIDRIDGSFNVKHGRVEGVYDDVYPGMSTAEEGMGHVQDGNYWVNRVFTPFGPTGVDDEGHYETVSTLTLEALAYLPPAIINEVRLRSRQTKTAIWSNLSYDSGRYAFCAVDVSDCFDLNKVKLDRRRTSAANERVNLYGIIGSGAAFKQTEYSDSQIDNVASQLGLKLDEIKSVGDVNYFVSLADYNVYARGSGFTPFYDYIGKSGGDSIYGNSDDELLKVGSCLFITDTWFPPTNMVNAGVKKLDLRGGDQYQPVVTYVDNANLMEPLANRNITQLSSALMKNVGGVGLMCLYDYLDGDSVPVSYCVPTVETAPMIAGLGLAHKGQFKPTAALAGGDGNVVSGKYDSGEKDPDTGETIYYYRRATKVKLNSYFSQLAVQGVAVFPFLRAKTKNYDGSYSGKVMIKVFWAPKNLKCRLDADSPIAEGGDWPNRGTKDGILTVTQDINVNKQFSNDVKTPQDAVGEFTAAISGGDAGMTVCWIVEDAKDEGFSSIIGTPYASMQGIAGDESALKPYDRDGKLAAWWTTATGGKASGDMSSLVSDGLWTGAPEKFEDSSEVYVPHVAVWARLTVGDDTVDVVPARLKDDVTFGKKTGLPDVSVLENSFPPLGYGVPVIAFRGDTEFSFGSQATAKLKGEADNFSSWANAYAVDPRFNFAPENWFANTGTGEVRGQEWLDAITPVLGSGSGDDRLDGDIFMFTSDQEFLQSINELVFIPYLQDCDGSGAAFEGIYKNRVSYSGLNFADGQRIMAGPGGALGKFAAGEFFWRTYTPEDVHSMRDGSQRLEVIAGEGDFRVNPFSRDPRVMMSVVKGTPFDWYVAATNKEFNSISPSLTPSQAGEWTFSDSNPVAKWEHDEMEDLAAAMRDGFANEAKSRNGFCGWEDAFDDLDWNFYAKTDDQRKRLFGVELDEPLYSVDRKFLHGFWRECFQNRQQLFLVFIRAEPLTVGGMGTGSMANSQLGARGVALVWRDPAPPARGAEQRRHRDQIGNASQMSQVLEQSGPHRTRVLFYHQFD